MTAGPRHLIVTPARALSAATVASCVSKYALDPASTSVVTNASLAADGTLGEPSASVDVLVSLADDDARWHAPAILAQLKGPHAQ